MTAKTRHLAACAPAALLLLGWLGAASAAEPACAKGPVTVGLLPKLDTDPYFGVARTGAGEA